jgi:hypothetical protein
MPRGARVRSFAAMTPRMISLALAGLLALVAAPAADAAKRKPKRMSATYMTTIKAELENTWQYREFAEHDCLDGWCSREDKGSGTITTFLKTKRPFPVLVGRGFNGRPPSLNLGSDGIPMTGAQLVQGTDTTTYGGPWAAANPNSASETTGCGQRTIDDFALIGWEDLQTGGGLHLTADLTPFREDCPDAPDATVEWEGGESLLVSDVVASVGKGKFLGTKQFTVRGTATRRGLVPTISEPHVQQNGSSETTIAWEATFRAKGWKKRR